MYNIYILETFIHRPHICIRIYNMYKVYILSVHEGTLMSQHLDIIYTKNESQTSIDTLFYSHTLDLASHLY